MGRFPLLIRRRSILKGFSAVQWMRCRHSVKPAYGLYFFGYTVAKLWDFKYN